MFNRRQFLVAGVAGFTGLVTWRFVRSNDENAIIMVLKERLDYLLLEEKGLHDFARDLAAQKILSSNKLRLLNVAGPLYTQLAITTYKNPLSRAVWQREERIVSMYLMSSDFFLSGADETRLVRYTGFYDPIRDPRPCSNPFSRPIVIGHNGSS